MPAKTKAKTTVKKKVTSKKAKAAMEADADGNTPAPVAAAATSEGLMKFSRDIAPIIAANCGRCHIANHRSGYNQTTFEGLLKGGKTGNDIVPGKPEESLLIARIKRDTDAGAPMPPGQAQLSQAAIDKIEQWVREGARLDAPGSIPLRPMAKYAASP